MTDTLRARLAKHVLAAYTPDEWNRYCDVTCENCGHQRRFWITAEEPRDDLAEAALREQFTRTGWHYCDRCEHDYCPTCTTNHTRTPLTCDEATPGLWPKDG